MHPLFHPLFVDYCAYFNGNEDYFECHEVLEEYWKDVAPGDKEHVLVGFVQIATGLYHWRRGNVIGATRMLKKARHNLLQNEQSSFVEFVALEQLLLQIDKALFQIASDNSFTGFQFPLTNFELEALVTKRMKSLPHEKLEFLVNKHMLRDRTSILRQREENKKKKTANNPHLT